jgi:hypothetical protein
VADELPELTNDERAALKSCDMTGILGTWEERCIRAESFALRMFRERNAIRDKLSAVEALWNAAVDAEGTDWADEIVEAARAAGGQE